MTGKRSLEFEFPGAGDSETFGGSSVGFNFWHLKFSLKNSICVVQSSETKGFPNKHIWREPVFTDHANGSCIVLQWDHHKTHHDVPGFQEKNTRTTSDQES